MEDNMDETPSPALSVRQKTVNVTKVVMFLMALLYLETAVVAEPPTYADADSVLRFRGSVEPDHHNAMFMSLSPSRKTVLSLGNSKMRGSSKLRKKPVVKYKNVYLLEEKSDDPLENQTETEDNERSGLPHAPVAQSDHEKSASQQTLLFARLDKDPAEDNRPYNENESQLVMRSALQNVSIDSQGSSSAVAPEPDQVWSAEDMSAEFSEEDDFHSLIAGFLKREIWTIPLFVFASLNIFLISLFEIYVLCRTQGQTRKHLFLGQMLLLGLFLCSSLALLFALYPSLVGCFLSRLGVGVSYSIVFSVLMVKCIFLLCLDMGIYLPTSYQAYLLFFAILVQVALDTQNAIFSPPVFQDSELFHEDSLFIQCGTTYENLLFSLSYVGFLMLVVGFLSAKATFRGITENFRESVYIFTSVVISIPIAISWILAGWILEGRHQDACVAFGLVAQSLTVFLLMFMPKGRQLAAMGKEFPYEEDDQFSRYSPSFFHFKPSNKSCKTTIFGDGNLYTTLEPTLSTINPNVFFQRPEYHAGMIY